MKLARSFGIEISVHCAEPECRRLTRGLGFPVIFQGLIVMQDVRTIEEGWTARGGTPFCPDHSLKETP